jgi:uncharacterized membrane protein YdbT with pleckstrin-like domain
MKIDTNLIGSLPDSGATAARVEALDYDGVYTFEGPHDPFFPLALVPLICKFVTLRYRFDDSGIAMQWGVLFRKEIYLTHRRIQDIHLTRNIVQRWFGLATVAVQTASGSATPEMSIEGILKAAELRNYLYTKMRGARGEPASDDPEAEGGADGDALRLLTEIRDSMRQLAEAKSDQ